MITEYTISQADQWDQVVRSFPDYDVFYLSGYSAAFMQESPKNGIPMLLLYEDGADRAITVVLRRDIALDEKFVGKLEASRYYDLITPYGYGGFLGHVSDWDRLNHAYDNYCLEHHYVCEFVRFSLFSDYQNHYNGEVESRTHNVVRSLDMPLEEMWMDFKQKVRKNVKKANSFGLQIIVESEGSYLDDFLRIYYGTMDRSDAKEEFYFSKSFYEKLATMDENIVYFHVVHEGKIISTELVIYGAENAYSYLGGTDRDSFDVRPNDFLKYEIIKWAKAKGLKNFVLGGGYGQDDGIFQYKACLAPNGICAFYIGRKIFDRQAYDHLIALRGEESLDERFFPKYRS